MKRTEVTITIPAGEDFTVPGYEFVVDGIALVVHRVGPGLGWRDDVPRWWRATEPLTGGTFSTWTDAPTRTQACKRATSVVRKAGANRIRDEIRAILQRAA